MPDPKNKVFVDTPYQRFNTHDLILRDELAIDRTLLANERTFLAYLRSAIALVIAGLSIMNFTEPGWFWGVGMFSIPLGMVVGYFGYGRYRKMDQQIAVLRKLTGTETSIEDRVLQDEGDVESKDGDA